MTFAAPSEGVSQDVRALARAVEEALQVAPSVLPGQVAVARAEGLLVLQERVAALALAAVADVEARELWRVRAAGSTRTWLRTLPCGDRGQLALARSLQDRPVLSAALAAGEVSLRTAGVVARELARVPGHVQAEQLQGVLVDGLGDLLAVWAGAACLEATAEQEREFQDRRDRLAKAVRVGLVDGWTDAAGQLEPAFVLAAQVLTPAEVESGLRVLVDALQPEADADASAEREYRSRGLVLRKLAGGGWSLRAHLTDETGQLLFQELAVREDTHPLQKARATRAAARAAEAGAAEAGAGEAAPGGAGGVTVEDVFGRHSTGADPGAAGTAAAAAAAAASDEADAGKDIDAEVPDIEVPDGEVPDGEVPDIEVPEADDDAVAGEAEDDPPAPDDPDDPDDEPPGGAPDDSDVDAWGDAGSGIPFAPASPASPAGPAVEGTPLPSKDQRAHDALARLLADLAGVLPGSGAPAPAYLTVIAPVTALDGRPGAPPGTLGTGKGDRPLTPSRLRSHACRSVLCAVLLDAHGRPVAASGEHRHATARERRAMRAAWGGTCAVNGCTLPGEIPHHAEPWWTCLQTALKDLVPLCGHHHHDVHDGHKTLRLRDGRLLDEWGWTRAA